MLNDTFAQVLSNLWPMELVQAGDVGSQDSKVISIDSHGGGLRKYIEISRVNIHSSSRSRWDMHFWAGGMDGGMDVLCELMQ